MKNHELLDMIGEVNEDYVLAADNNVVRPRFRWRTLAACAACGLLVLAAAYPLYLADHPPLHSYTVAEGDGMVKLEGLGGGIDTPGQNTPEPDPTHAQPHDAAGQWKAVAQYQGLLQGMGGQGGREPEPYPGWYGGAWIDGTGDRLAVAVVDGFHTGELEAQIEEWCGGEVVFVQDMKYSYAHLLDLNEQILQALLEHPNQDDAWSAFSSMRPDIMANCLVVGFSDIPSDAALAFLARLDPAGDAIQVRAFTGRPDALTDGEAKGPAPGVSPATPVPEDPAEESPAPGGATGPAVEELPQGREQFRPAGSGLLCGVEG